MKPIFLPLLILFSVSVWAQNTTNEDCEILKITNFAGLTGFENAVEMTFPGNVEFSKIVYTYSFQKFPKKIVDSISFDGLNIGREELKKRLNYKGKPTSSLLNVVSTQNVLKFYIDRLDKKKKKAEFNWKEVGVGQPQIYSSRKQKKSKLHKRRYNKWLLKEVTIYAKKLPEWFNEKNPEEAFPQLSIENLLLGFPEKEIGRDGLASNDGIKPRVTMSNIQNVHFIKVSQPSSADRENCNDIGYKYKDTAYELYEKLLKIEKGSSLLDIEFFNKNGKYQEDYMACKPLIEVMFHVPIKTVKPQYEVVDYGVAVRDTIISTIKLLPEPVVTKCEFGTISCGRVDINFTPEQRITSIYRNEQYRIIDNNAIKDTILVVRREPLFSTADTVVAYIEDVEIRPEHEASFRKANYQKGGNQISITNLDTGSYFLKINWKLNGIEIDTTVFTNTKALDIEKNIKEVLCTDTIFFTIDPGGTAPPGFSLSTTPMERKCLTLGGDKNCDDEVTSIYVGSTTSRFLVVGLDRAEMGEHTPEELIDFDRNGKLVPFTNEEEKIKNINCKKCEQYEENEILWNGIQMGGILIFDLKKIKTNTISFKAELLKDDGPINLYYQYISLTPNG